jgi:hypothetical protein
MGLDLMVLAAKMPLSALFLCRCLNILAGDADVCPSLYDRLNRQAAWIMPAIDHLNS